MTELDTERFYDGLAADYHLIYGDRWEAGVERQGAALTRLIATLNPQARTVLDCACGIGTQAIGLALDGYAVTGTDISARSLRRAHTEAERFGVALTTEVADFRELEGVGGPFDVVVCADNALPHMLGDDDLERALDSIRGRLNPGGLLVLSTRDYDATAADRPRTAAPQLIDGPPRQVVVRVNDWDGPDSPLHTVRFLILTDSGDGWTVVEHRVRYRAVTRRELSTLAARVGLVDIRWRSPEQTGFFQPVMTARR